MRNCLKANVIKQESIPVITNIDLRQIPRIVITVQNIFSVFNLSKGRFALRSEINWRVERTLHNEQYLSIHCTCTMFTTMVS